MKTIVRWIRVSVAIVLGLVFLKAQGGSSDPKDLLGDEAREIGYVVVSAIEKLCEDCDYGKLGQAIGEECAVLLGPGDPPRQCPKPRRPWSDLLSENVFDVQGWQGPYLESLIEDPWGHSFVITVSGLVEGRHHVWVISAGPNGRLDTSARDSTSHGDDIALLAHW